MADAKLTFDLLARDRASRTFDRVGRSAQTTGQKLAGVAKGVAFGFGVVAAGGVGFFAKKIGEGIRAAAEMEVLLKKTNAVIKSTGNVAKISVKSVAGLAAEMENMSGVDEALIINSQNVLATFTKVRNEAGKGRDIFNQATRAALDMSVALGTDLQSATIQIGKALNDPIKGITALSRAGVSFTEGQKAAIREMVKAGDIMGAQKLILKELATEFGGAAKAAGDTFSGKVARAKDAIDDAAREIGKQLLPALASVATWVAEHGVPAFVRFAEGIKASWNDVSMTIASNLLELVASFDATFGAMDRLLGKLPGTDTKISDALGAAREALERWNATAVNAEIAKLQADVTQADERIKYIKSKLADPKLTATYRAKLEAEIASLLANKAKAQASIDSLRGKGVPLTAENRTAAGIARARADLGSIPDYYINLYVRYIQPALDLPGGIGGKTGGTWTGRGFRKRGYAHGGVVDGPGSGTSDSVFAPWLSRGEFVMPAQQTEKFLPALEAMRRSGGRRGSAAAAGGMDPRAYARALVQELKAAGLTLVAVDTGRRADLIARAG